MRAKPKQEEVSIFNSFNEGKASIESREIKGERNLELVTFLFPLLAVVGFPLH